MNTYPKFPLFKNPIECRAWIRANGICISEWCRALNLNRQIVSDLLRGKIKGHRGEAHHTAIALGLKPDPAGLRRAA